jgi:hypothetical protein
MPLEACARLAPGNYRSAPAVESPENGQEHIMPILLWLLGVPLSVVIVLALTGVI